MEESSWLDVVIKRLRFFTRPVPLASTVGVLLLSVFIWDFVRHPEWFGAFENDSTGLNEELDSTGLTPEEQAAAAGLDNLTLLMNELGVEPGNAPQIQALPEGDLTGQNSFLNGPLVLSQGNRSGSSLEVSPFSDYLQQYQFGRNSIRANPTSSGSSSQFGGLDFNSFGLTSSNTATDNARPINPLAEALRNQSGLTGTTSTQTNSPLADELRSLSTDSQQNAEVSTDDREQVDIPPGEFSSQTVTIPGIAYPVLPTQPQMSPPPGTTGYTPPASLELMPPLPGSSNSPTAFPGTAASTSSPGVTGSSVGTGVPALNTPNVDVSNGYVTPYAPTGANATTNVSPTPITPQPFTAPRAPGVYTGGGYINTFANPSGPSNSNSGGN